jgi:hypothetical protein
MKIYNKILTRIRYDWSYLKILNSPFKPLKLIFYFGDISIGHPYFLPRKWVKNKEKPGYLKAVYIRKFGFVKNTLGWKTKFDEFRFEFNPGFSFIILGKQLYIGIRPNIHKDCMDDVYWEAWLNYENRTNKNLSKKERVKELIKNHSCTWTRYSKNEKTTTDYYPYILKKKYWEKD